MPVAEVALGLASPKAWQLSYHRPTALTAEMRAEMWAIFARGVRTERAAFEAGLDRMDEMWLLQADGRVLGFGGVRFFRVAEGGSACQVIFTGRVYLDPSVRGNSVIQRVGLHYYWRCAKAHPLERVYWMFGAGTYKSYLLLPRNFRSYWPRPGVVMPPWEKHVLTTVAAQLSPMGYDPSTGCMRHPEVIFLDGGLEGDREALADPDVAYYAALNPQQASGDDLMCLCPLTPLNWAACFVRMLARMRRRKSRLRP